MRILAIDPGNETSAWVEYDMKDRVLLGFGMAANDQVLVLIGKTRAHYLAVEMVASYGMPVGRTVFETCIWVGRFVQMWRMSFGVTNEHFVYRQDVKMHLCHSMRAKDANIRQAIIDRYPATGGGKVRQIGTKKSPGPLYGVSKDVWSALAVAITWAETQANELEDDA